MPAKLAVPRTAEELHAMDRERGRRYRTRHPGRTRESGRRWREKHPGETTRRVQDWNARHPGRMKATFKEWYTKPENAARVIARSKIAVKVRRARSQGAAGSHTQAQWLARVALHGWCCRYCRESLTPATLTMDHAIPLSRGGSEWPANLVPACGSCNSRKQRKTLREFLGV